MPTPPPDRSRRSLSHGQEMFLLYGPADRWEDAFADEREVCEAWRQHRVRILTSYRHGRRPWAWWALEAGDLRYPGHDKERAVLYEVGLLTETEVTELTAKWREDFERAQQPGFTYCVGFAKPGDTVATWLEGAAARRAHYRWAGTPRSLLKEWRTQRRRLGRTVRELEEATTSPEPAPAA
jgi:hypothetical protein